MKPGETARLDFKPDDMNDVLKSLTVTDRNGGKVNGVRYDSSDPLEKRLEDFPFRLGAGASLAAFLDQMKGARIELKLGAGDAAGIIISARVVQESDKSQREVLVLLMDSGDIRSFDLGAASAVKLSDPKLQSQLAAYLTVLNQSHARDRRRRNTHRCSMIPGCAAVDAGLHDAGGGVEIELPFDVRRGGRAYARRLGDYRQHLGRRLEQRAAGGGVGQAGTRSMPTTTKHIRLPCSGRMRSWRRIWRRLQWCIREPWKRRRNKEVVAAAAPVPQFAQAQRAGGFGGALGANTF